MFFSTKPMSPFERDAALAGLRLAVEILEKVKPRTCCLNCANRLENTRYCSVFREEVPASYEGDDCKSWNDFIPF